MAVAFTVRKDPDATRDYGFDWQNHPDGAWLVSAEVISSASWTVPSGLTEGAKETGLYVTKIWLSGGTAGETYEVSCEITTDDGRIDERTFEVVVEER